MVVVKGARQMSEELSIHDVKKDSSQSFMNDHDRVVQNEEGTKKEWREAKDGGISILWKGRKGLCLLK